MKTLKLNGGLMKQMTIIAGLIVLISGCVSKRTFENRIAKLEQLIQIEYADETEIQRASRWENHPDSLIIEKYPMPMGMYIIK